MPDRDAFGRLVDEDPIEAMGWAAPKGAITRPQALQRQHEDALGVVQARLARSPSAGAAVRRAQDAASRSPGGLAATANESFGEVVRTGRSAVRARRSHGTAAQAFGGARRAGGLLRAVVVLLVLAWVLPVGAIVDGVREVADRPAAEPSGGPLPEVRAGSAVLTTAGFAEALEAVREEAGRGADPVYLRVDADGVQVEVRTPAGTRRGLEFSGGRVAELYQQGSAEQERTFAWSAIDTRAASRLARSVDGFGHAVLVRTPTLRWTAFAGDRSYVAGPDGRDPEPV